MKIQTVAGLGPALAVVLLAGCTGSGGGTVKVTGTVTYNGQPVSGASVAFVPENGRGASGVTDAQGNFTLSTFKSNDGAVPGLHQVAITPAAAADAVPPMPGMPGYEEAQAAKPPFPAKYGDIRTSGFTAKVEKGATNHFTFDMKDE